MTEAAGEAWNGASPWETIWNTLRRLVQSSPASSDPLAPPSQRTLNVLITRYFLAELTDPSSWSDWKGAGEMQVTLANVGTRTYPVRFVNAVKGEGTGMVPEGVIQYDTESHDFVLLDTVRYPHGVGAKNNPLVTFKSIAVDKNVIPLGTVCHLPLLQGLLMPDGSQHDGQVTADDTGGAITGNHIDLFCEKKKWADKLATMIPERGDVILPV